jgi:DNA-binding beta-propeller fold protein YncE
VAVDSRRVYVAVRSRYRGCDPEDKESRRRGFDHVAVFDLDAGAVPSRSLLTTNDPTDVALTKQWLWVAAGRNTVLQVDPENGTINDQLTVGDGLTSGAADEDGIWALSRNNKTGLGTVTRIDPNAVETVRNPIDVDGMPLGLAGDQIFGAR